MFSKEILGRMKFNIGFIDVSVTDNEEKLATTIALLAQQEIMQIFMEVCKEHPSASGRWVAKEVHKRWFMDQDLDDGKDSRIVIPGR